jgi:hypothetical protein
MNKDSTPINIFLLFFTDMIQLLVAETNKYYYQYLHTLDNDDGCSQLQDVTVQGMYIFFGGGCGGSGDGSSSSSKNGT